MQSAHMHPPEKEFIETSVSAVRKINPLAAVLNSD